MVTAIKHVALHSECHLIHGSHHALLHE